MELNNLHIRNYRCFEDTDICFNNHLTLFVGKNGAGKTTLKDARYIIDIAEQMQKQIMLGDAEIVLPILSYYGTGRLYAQKKEKRNLKALQKCKPILTISAVAIGTT